MQLCLEKFETFSFFCTSKIVAKAVAKGSCIGELQFSLYFNTISSKHGTMDDLGFFLGLWFTSATLFNYWVNDKNKFK